MMIYDVDTALLRSFVVLAETGSFSRTGRRVGRSQSAISGQIRKLEDALGRVLFDRTTRRVRLTRDGEALLGYARRMIATADAMIDHFRSADIAGEVRFAAPDDFASAYLPGILGEFAAAHEFVTLHVSCELTLRLIEQFEAGLHDLVIVKSDPARPYPGARKLRREALVWVGAPALALPFDEAQRRYAALERALPLVLSPAPCVYRSRAAAALDARGVAWTPTYMTQSLAGSLAAVRAGLGWSVMPRAMVPEDLAALDERLGWPALDPAEIALLTREPASPAAAALAGFIEERVPGEADLAQPRRVISGSRG